MNIQLKGWKVLKLEFKANEKKSKKDNTFDLGTNSFFLDEEQNVFFVDFSIEIRDKEFSLSLEANFKFQLEGEGDFEAFKKSTFPRVNAPAIAFPYLRAFISVYTQQAGYKSVILPSINFIELDKENEMKSSNKND